MDWDAIVQQFLPSIVRMTIIVFSTLGVVYMCGRLLFPKLKDMAKNRIAFITVVVIAYTTTLMWDYPWMIQPLGAPNITELLQFALEGFLYGAIGTVFYIVIGWRFYSRVDAFLDKKFGKDDKRRQ